MSPRSGKWQLDVRVVLMKGDRCVSAAWLPPPGERGPGIEVELLMTPDQAEQMADALRQSAAEARARTSASP